MMKIKQICIIIGYLVLVGCSSDLPTTEQSLLADSLVVAGGNFLETDIDSMPNEYQTYYIVVADTSADYFKLQQKMFLLEDKLLFEIDTLGRYYNPKTNLICLPEESVDEVFAGDYFPRRSPSATLSLEYLNFYKPAAAEKTIALVAGIYEGEGEANVRLADVKKVVQSAFVIKSDVFVGCMH